MLKFISSFLGFLFSLLVIALVVFFVFDLWWVIRPVEVTIGDFKSEKITILKEDEGITNLTLKIEQGEGDKTYQIVINDCNGESFAEIKETTVNHNKIYIMYKYNNNDYELKGRLSSSDFKLGEVNLTKITRAVIINTLNNEKIVKLVLNK